MNDALASLLATRLHALLLHERAEVDPAGEACAAIGEELAAAVRDEFVVTATGGTE